MTGQPRMAPGAMPVWSVDRTSQRPEGEHHVPIQKVHRATGCGVPKVVSAPSASAYHVDFSWYRPRFPRIPFTAYVAADMVDLAQAHASYRFVVQDEENGITRILVWLFKPSIQLSYAGATGSVIPASGTITAAKVTFVIFGPGEPANSLERYPTFRNAEVLSYPMDLCRRLAASLKESNAVYPEARRTLDGMSLGWLQRT
ncbi:hypothetical protein FS749_003470 [Ceratobasidium sp. UAMH 11750]|nr:hypothetical protein FS749_003470 [Ceratobasidium sp. UAMH 11750]